MFSAKSGWLSEERGNESHVVSRLEEKREGEVDGRDRVLD